MPLTFRKAFRDLSKRKLRSLLTIIGIVVGVAGIVAIISTSRNLADAQGAAYNNNSQQDQSWGVADAPEALANAVRRLPNVAAAERRADYYSKWLGGDIWRDIYFLGIEDFGNQQVNRVDLVAGHWPGPGEVAFEVSARDVAPIALGDVITFRAGDGGQTRKLTVSGFARSPSYPSATIIGVSIAYSSASEVRRMSGSSGDSLLLVRLANFDLRDQTRNEIQLALNRQGTNYGGFRQRDPANYPGKRELDALVTMMLAFSVVGLVISAFLVSNTLAALVGEQSAEIGAMKAIGATSRQVLVVYVIGGLLYGLAGTVAGTLLGLAGAFALVSYLASLLNLSIGGLAIVPEALLAGAGVGMGVTMAASLLPAWRGTAISVRQALESYGINATYGQGAIDRLVQRLSRLPRIPAMALRNLARRKGRNALTLLVIALSTAAFLGAQGTSASVDRTINALYDLYGSDAWVWFNQPVSLGFAQTLRAMPEVRSVEAWSNDGATIGDTRTSLWGMPADTRLYKYQILTGRWFAADEQGAAVISKQLADDRGMATGDSFELTAYGADTLFHVIGVVEDNAAALGTVAVGKVFVPLSVVGRIAHRQGNADFFALQLDDPAPAHVEDTLAQLEHKYRDLSPGMIAVYQDRQRSLDTSRILALLLFSMVVIVATIGGIGVANTLTMNVLERRREIGVLRAIGAGNSHILQAFFTEALCLGGIGYLLGVALGYPVTWLLTALLGNVLFPIPFYLPGDTIVSAGLFTLGLTTVASVGPALGAARLRVREALRYE